MAAMDVRTSESMNGLRMSWNIWPCSQQDASRIVVPLGCLYTPLKNTEALQLVEYEPVMCKAAGCGAVLNPCCFVDFRLKSWTCPFCLQRNPFPPHYAEHITESNLPAELLPHCSTMEYILPQSVCTPPVFILVLDIALIEEELEQAKDSLQQSLAVMPQNALVGFITFGANCFVHELVSGTMPHSFAFRGTKEYLAKQVSYQLGFGGQGGNPGRQTAIASRRFLMPVAECEFMLNSLLDELSRDSWPSSGFGRRPQRCTGAALSIALGLAEATYPNSSCHVALVVGGPCNVGPGMVVGEELAETIRSHLDLQKDKPNARYSKGAMKYYADLASRAVSNGFSVDLFACSLDQVGLHEMKVLPDKTGGYMVMSDSFSMSVFKESFRKMFDCDAAGYLQVGFNAKIEAFTSKELKVSGAIGALSALSKKKPNVAEVEVGEGGTCQWIAGSLDKKTTVAFFFEIAAGSGPNIAVATPGEQGYLQFQTTYFHPSGRKRLRVTTVSHQFASANMMNITAGFDQEAAAVLTARYVVAKGEKQEWVDTMLIRLVKKFAEYSRDDPSSFRLAPELALFPQFMYHLRRSNFVQTFGTSPDETAYYRTIIMRENTLNSIVMIQPALLKYSFDEGPPQPVPLDTCSLKGDLILLMDNFFHVVIWRGEQIQSWYDSGFQDREEYAHFRHLLQAPAADAKQILADRFPVPKFIQTNAGGSQARFVTSKVNPSNGNASLGQTDATAVITDDVSLKAFMEHLIKLAVKS